MQYDPIKRSLGEVFNKRPFLRKLFYQLLDLLLLRAWHVKREIRHWAGSQPREGSKQLLDAGSGFGQYSYFMSGLNPAWQVDAVDVKEEQVADCNGFFKKAGRGNVRFEVADLTKFSRPGHYDLILSVDVMEHILEDEVVFRNFHDSLKPGGVLFISTPSDQGGSDVQDHDHEGSFIDEHVRDGYNMADLCEKLKRAGFTSTEAYYTYGKPGQAGWRLSMKYPILMLNASKIFFLILPFYYIVAYPVAFICNWMDCSMKHDTGTGLMVMAKKC